MLPQSYRPITLLNVDYNIFTSELAYHSLLLIKHMLQLEEKVTEEGNTCEKPPVKGKETEEKGKVAAASNQKKQQSDQNNMKQQINKRYRSHFCRSGIKYCKDQQIAVFFKKNKD